MDLMADWAICRAVKVTNAQPARKREGREAPDCGSAASVLGRALPTTAESIWASEDPALLYLSVRREHKSDVVLITFLRDHSNKQLPVFHCCIKHKAASDTAAPAAHSHTHFNVHVFAARGADGSTHHLVRRFQQKLLTVAVVLPLFFSLSAGFI